ncbi:heat shock 70 kDa protein 15-like protein [Tanacetum coccineum]
MDSDREQLITKLQETEECLYEYGEDETKGVYVVKFDKLKKLNLEFIVYGRKEFEDQQEEDRRERQEKLKEFKDLMLGRSTHPLPPN